MEKTRIGDDTMEKNGSSTEDFLLEVGSDEIPAGLLASAIANLSDRARDSLEAERLHFEDLVAYGAPRRLVLYVKNLSLQSTDKEEKVRGPSKKAAFDVDGNPTKALLGFCKSLGISPQETIIEENQNGEYVYGLKKEPGRSALEILPEIMPQVVMGMDCPRPLRWGDQNFRWYRPIRWVVCLLGEKVVPLEIAGQKAGRTSFGHRTLFPNTIQIHSARSYFEQMEKAGVIVDQDRRREIIWQGAVSLARTIGGHPVEDAALLEEVTNLSEHPAPFLGKFDASYLRLPREVLVTVMRHHQRYFPVLDERDNVLPGFIGVRDGDPQAGMETVRKGNEWVLRARLEDASFFYERDKEQKLETRIDGLKGVYFLRNAGTLFDKITRLSKLSSFLGEAAGLPPEARELLSQGVRLSKCDLLTLMVREFPELEGVMGGHYASEEGIDPEVCKALAQQYLPRGTRDKLPDKGIPALLAISDKLDTLSVAFCLGYKPTGSQDPIGLRRLAQGVVNIIEAYEYDLDLGSLLSRSMDLAGEFLKKDCSKAKEELWDFLMSRVESFLTDQGYTLEIARAVIFGGEKRIARLPKMARTLQDYDRLQDVVTGWRRTSVLAKSATGHTVQENLLLEEPEKRLYAEIKDKRERARTLFERGEYREYLDVLAGLRGPIDECLDKVLIMARETHIKENRLNLLALVSDLFTAYADFAYILPLLGDEK